MLKIFIFSAVLFFAFTNKSGAIESNAVFTNKTFAVSGKLDRFYFEENNKFSYQFAHPSGDYLPGDILKGEWSYNKNVLCLKYETIPTKFCFDHIFEKNRHILSTNEGKNVHFYLDDWKHGNWLLTSKGLDHLLRARHYKKEAINPEFDQRIINFLQGKVVKGFAKEKDFLFSSNGTILTIEKNSEPAKTDHVWSVQNGTLFIDNPKEQSNLIFVLTFGEEFIEPKNSDIFIYKGLYFPVSNKEKGIEFIQNNDK